MEVRTAPRPRDTGAGFTLVELLLAVALVVLLVSAVVFNFSGLQRGASLDEGVSQMESLIRFARAHAASSGRQVHITFEEDIGEGLLVPLGNLRVLWEPDPVHRPGVFEPLIEMKENASRLADLISIEGVRIVDGDSFAPASLDSSEPFGESSSVRVTFPPIAFLPDGSSDSAEIVLASRSDDDTRRIAVRLQGITGSIRRQLVTEELKAAPSETPPASADAAVVNTVP